MYIGLVKRNIKTLGKTHMQSKCNVSNRKALCWALFHSAAMWNKENAFICSSDTIFQKGDDEIKGMPQHGFYKSEN